LLKHGSSEEIELRASAIAACEEIIKRASQKFSKDMRFTSMELDYYLWTIGKDEEFRNVERHYTQDTVFY
jgi:hypothetical protein